MEGFLAANTLSCVVKMCLGKVTTIELRNEAFATGLITEVSKSLNQSADFSGRNVLVRSMGS